MMNEGSQPRAHVIKGKPIFKRHLYISSALFVFIIVVTSLILTKVAWDSLKDRVNAQIGGIGEANAQQIRDEIQFLNLQSTADPQAEAQKDAQLRASLDLRVAEQEELLYIFIQDLQGEVIWKSLKRGVELEQNHFSKALFSPKNPRPPRVDMPSLSNPGDILTDLMLPLLVNEQPQLILHLGLNSSLMERRFSKLRGIILNRILLGASAVVGILTLALLYVLWLLKRAQVVEAEAHMGDQLAYLGTLASGLAHEIRNPLSAMNLNLQMIEEEMVSPANPELERLLRGTRQEIDRLARLATNFLTYAKPISLDRHRVLVNDLLDEVVLLISNSLSQSGIELERENASEALELRGDKDLLKQAVLNLLVNAQDAVCSEKNPGGKIKLSTFQEGRQIHITVRDTGPGLSADDGKNLFRLFYSSKRGGTGLGLPIAQKIVESHGGRIDWRNHSQGGAEFVIQLPAA